MWFRFFALLLVAFTLHAGRTDKIVNARPDWSVGRSPHFEVFSDDDPGTISAALERFEQIERFFADRGYPVASAQRIRVIAFRSQPEYDQYRLRPASDAYFLSTETRDYIVVPSLRSANFGAAIHEYAHFAQRKAEPQFPLWLSEGISEFFSTLRFRVDRSSIGGDLPMRSQTLRTREWIPLRQMLGLKRDTPQLQNREFAAMFYAESWALTQMLATAPEYQLHFQDLLKQITPLDSDGATLASLYAKTIDSIAADLHAAIANRSFATISFPPVSAETAAFPTQTLSSFQSQQLLAELLLASGELRRAQSMFEELAKQQPRNADVLATLGTIALRRGDTQTASELWKQAIALGIGDADLCYRYALDAENTGASPDDSRSALERAVALQPDFDDARFKLALLESNTGDYEKAVHDLLSMRHVGTEREFGYWSALANAQEESGDRDGAVKSAEKASAYATNAVDRQRAAQLAYIAKTDLTVQFSRDAEGRPQIVTTRVAHNTIGWNPFIEPTDKIVRASATLRQVDCQAGVMKALVVTIGAKNVLLTIPDPQHVLVRNGKAEFVCGPQSNPAVLDVEYAEAEPDASSGVLRGITFH